MLEKIDTLFKTLGIPYEFVDFKVNAGGLATPEKVYIGKSNKLRDEKYVIALLLHEIAHYKRLKSGRVPDMELVIKEPFEKFFEIVLKEEQIAERYSQLCFYRIYGEKFLDKWSPTLINTKNRLEDIKAQYRYVHETVSVLDTTYLEFINSLIIKTNTKI